ncbi:MAG: beta-ketoacyl-[acyl-carrier-protein] synthase family protein [Pirellulaceae bacterium]
MPHSREVVVTGLGAVCPLGVGREAVWASLLAGRSGVRPIPSFAGSPLPFRFAGLIEGFEPKEYVQPRKTLKVMSSEIQAAYSAAMLALQDAGLAKDAVAPERLGVVLGSEMLYGELPELADAYRNCLVEGVFRCELWAEQAMKNLFPLWMLKYLPNMAACHIGIASDARGPNNSVVEGGVSSLLAFLEASQMILRGHADVMICGGVGATVSTGAIAFRGHEHLTNWQGPPDETPRPFDSRRDGTVVGEGSGMYILEAREHAEARGAKILARILGGSQLFEPAVAGRPMQGTAIAGTITAALAQVKLQPRDIGFVSANASGSVEGDAMEAQAIERTLGGVPVTAFKSYCGDIGAGSGSVELVASILALHKRSVPITKNYSQPDKACPVNVVKDELLPLKKSTVMALNQSATGQAAAVILGTP